MAGSSGYYRPPLPSHQLVVLLVEALALLLQRQERELVLTLLWLSHSQREGLAGIRGRAGFSGSVVTVAGGGGCGLLGGSFTGSFFFLCFSSFCQGASPDPPNADSTSSWVKRMTTG